MLLSLMSPQFLETAVAFSSVVGTAEIVVAVVLDAEMDGLEVLVQIAGAGKGFCAEGAGSALRGDRGWLVEGGSGWERSVEELGLNQRWIVDVVLRQYQRWIIETCEILSSWAGKCLLRRPVRSSRGCNGWIV
jgi:hypothetical protein